MSFDGLFTGAMTNEVASKLTTGRISKIVQPSNYEVLLTVRANGANYKLILSAHPSYARFHFTNQNYDTPSEPSMFTMLLRKHLNGGIIESITQLEHERIVTIKVRSRNEIGDEQYRTLIIELMGRHSNILLIDEEKQIILDSIKHVPMAVNRHRIVQPGATYISPPNQEKHDPFHVTSKEEFNQMITQSDQSPSEAIVQHFSGISPLLANEIVYNGKEDVYNSFKTIMNEIQLKKFTPSLFRLESRELFYFINLSHLQGEQTIFDSLSELLDVYYFGKAERDRVKQQSGDLEKLLQNELTKNKKKIKKLHKSLEDTDKADKIQLQGELLTANMFAVQKGMKEIEVINYYDENGATVVIPLSPLKTPSENAQAYFTKYTKLKNSVAHIEEQIKLTKEENDYLETVIQQIESASPRDLEEIREELVETGYIKKKKSKKAQKSNKQKVTLDEYISTTGEPLLVGKNNKQNDYLTNKLASRDELWFHTKDIPGSHVVIRAKDPSETAIKEAAIIAAYFSKARQSSSVPVDYTEIRHVKKPNGSKPGFVIYEQNNTVYVTPDEELVLKLKK
ncbi:Rqc2 family fibronectin-binding protein [Gottfriedia acidiceleris]|uniref:Rqc2 homolog RqcH n=1 Tax=Gottfriedia acidiceleris TaxID=371036 RepID=A0ABY4JGY3_9BACI|nr:NFACT RNA binding domain-containing protein [Gottfriedia acidiceleris]UPM53084.1 NFACT family protein [Gottfriedia acidiceleris]